LQQLAKLLLQLVTLSEKKNTLYVLANIALCTGTINYVKKSKVKYLYRLCSREIFNCILDFIHEVFLGQNDKKVQSIILSRMELLPEDEQEIVVSKYKSAEAAGNIGTSSTSQNQFLMRLLRAHCELKQARHVHDTAENR